MSEARRPRAVFLCHEDRHLYQFRLCLMRALVARGWEVFAASQAGAYSGRFAAEGVTHVPYRVRRSSLNPLREAFVVRELAGVLADLRPDLLHTFAMKPNIYGAFAASFAGVAKRVATVAGLGSFYVDPGPPSLSRRALDALYGAAMRRVDRMVFENPDDLAEMTRLGVCRPGQGIVIQGAGVDLRRFRPGPARAAGPVVVTMAARLIRDKGVGEFLSAAEAMKAKWGDGVVFQLAGEEDPGNLWSADLGRISDAAARGVVRRLGFVEDVPGLLAGTDVYALPSYREGTPVSVLEAMSAGLAVVTTDAVGCRETVVPEVSGLRVPVRDSAALAAALDRLIADPELRGRLGRGARARAEAVFAEERVVAAHLEAYRALLPSSFPPA